MVINKTNYCYQIRSDKPNKNWLGNDYYLLEDGSELANKVIQYFPYILLTIEENRIISVEEDTIKKEEEKFKRNIEDEILQLKQNLINTDYQAIKYAEGQILIEDYAPIKEQRQAWRDEINRLEAELNESEN